VGAARYAPPVNLPASMPIYESAAWTFRDLDELEPVLAGEQPGVMYGSFGVPNHDALESVCRALEHAEAAVATNGGMTAIFGALFTHLVPGDRVVASYNLFGPTMTLLRGLERYDIQTTLVDGCDLQEVERALREPTRVLLVETISNPRLRVADIPALADLAHRADAVLFVDNTFASPALCRPLEHGADLVLESLTKFVVGHYDTLAGLVAAPAELVEPLRASAVLTGSLVGPFEAWLAVRGAQTMSVRVRQASDNAAALADWLADRPEVLDVHYPDRSDHPDHMVARKLFGLTGGAMLAFDIDGDRSTINRMLRALEHIRMVTSLGGVATTIHHPVSTSHRDVARTRASALGFTRGSCASRSASKPLPPVVDQIGGRRARRAPRRDVLDAAIVDPVASLPVVGVEDVRQQGACLAIRGGLGPAAVDAHPAGWLPGRQWLGRRSVRRALPGCRPPAAYLTLDFHQPDGCPRMRTHPPAHRPSRRAHAHQADPR
jgi:cystathionine beta-lyase/cystathionine gamma-synthase